MLGPLVGVVVLHLVVVPGDQGGGGGVQGLQVGVGVILGVAEAIAGQVLRLRVGVAPQGWARAVALVLYS